jgi:hypothetical protein
MEALLVVYQLVAVVAVVVVLQVGQQHKYNTTTQGRLLVMPA